MGLRPKSCAISRGGGCWRGGGIEEPLKWTGDRVNGGGVDRSGGVGEGVLPPPVRQQGREIGMRRAGGGKSMWQCESPPTVCLTEPPERPSGTR